jgi:NADH-quinone oxidoreductase subunit G
MPAANRGSSNSSSGLPGVDQIASMDPDILLERMRAMYEVDRRAPRRRSYENRSVRALYDAGLGEPNSAAACALLHTSHAARHFSRLLLMLFLDAVDRRDVLAVDPS